MYITVIKRGEITSQTTIEIKENTHTYIHCPDAMLASILYTGQDQTRATYRSMTSKQYASWS